MNIFFIILLLFHTYKLTGGTNDTNRQSVVFRINLKRVVLSPKWHVIQVLGEMELKLYKSLTSTQDRSELSASLFQHFFNREYSSYYSLNKSVVGELRNIWQRIIPVPVTNISPVVQPVTGWAVPAPHLLHVSLFNDDISSVEMMCWMNW
jgi:hypothetical protein